MAACKSLGTNEIENNELRLVRGIESAVEVVSKAGIKPGFTMKGFDLAKFMEVGYDCRVFDSLTRGEKRIRLDFETSISALECMRFHGLKDKQIEAYPDAAKYFIRETEGGAGSQPTKYLMKAVRNRPLNRRPN